MMSNSIARPKLAAAAAIVIIALMSILLTQCAQTNITSQYVAEGCPVRSITVLPITDPSLSEGAAVADAERIADRLELMYPNRTVTVDQTMVGQPESAVLEYARTNLKTSHFLHGQIWDKRREIESPEVVLSLRDVLSSREVWSLSCKADAKAVGAGNWEEDVGAAIDEMLARLPEREW
jgi:hypothetical protein